MSSSLLKNLFYIVVFVIATSGGHVFVSQAQQIKNVANVSLVADQNIVPDQNQQATINTDMILNGKHAPDLLLARKNATLTAEGKGVCSDKHDKPSISKKKNHNHMDEDCCADYDEWPNPGCAYSAGALKVMLKGPTPGHVRR